MVIDFMEKGNRKLHFFDRYFGIPLVYFLGLLRKKNKKIPEQLNKIAIINLVSIGDNVLMSGIVRDILSQYPNAQLTVFTGATNYYLVKLIKGVSAVIKLPITNPLRSVQILRGAGKFDIVIDFVSWPRLNAIYTFFTKAKYRIGFKVKDQYKHYVYDSQVQHRNDIHEIDNLRNLIKDFYHGESHLPMLQVLPTINSANFINKAGRYCIIHAWPGGYKSYLKEWSISNWANLVNLIEKDFDHIVITGGPSDTNKSMLLESSIIAVVDKSKVINMSGKLTLNDTANLISNCALIITVNTGIAHIAAAFKKDQICLHGPTNVLRWAPYDNNTISIVPNNGIYGYLNFGFEYYKAKENCMENISVDTVYMAYLSLVNSYSESDAQSGK